MKVLHQWLQSFFSEPVAPEGVADVLTALGLEVEATIDTRGEWAHVVVGEVLAAKPHPDADKLSLCEVQVGEAAPLAIVCGAPNVRAGLKVAVAMVDAVLPGNFKIKRSKIRGEASHGMLCGASELGLEDALDGIMELPADAPVGTPLADYFQAEDVVWDIAITPNRPDCLSVRGVARELALQYAKGFQDLEAKTPKVQHDERVTVQMLCPERCLHYAALVVNALTPCSTPWWFKARLQRAGVRSIHPVVDVCNAVMLIAGQPMHAFDADRIEGDIVVRMAQPDEQVVLLDGVERTLCVEDLVIADDTGVLALAGVMGGQRAEVREGTTRVVLESAYFEPDGIRATAQRYALHSESSHRFERGIDPAQQAEALCLAHAWMQPFCGGEAGPITAVEVAQGARLAMPTIALPLAKVTQVLGVVIEMTQAQSQLAALGMVVKAEDDVLHVTPPSYRRDLLEPIDLIEELCRCRGLDALPATPLHWREVRIPSRAVASETDTASQVLVHAGYQEAIHFAVTSRASQVDFVTDPDTLMALKNPLSDEFSTLRGSLWPGLLKTVQYHLRRQQHRMRFFEVGACFEAPDRERLQCAGVITGDRLPVQWGVRSEKVDFYDIKQDVINILAALGWADQVTWSPAEHPALHPHQSMVLQVQGEVIGHVGAVSPILLKKMKISQPVMAFAMDLTRVRGSENAHQNSKSKKVTAAVDAVAAHPVVHRDLALIVPKALTYAQVYQKIEDVGKKLLIKCELFDIYVGGAMEDGSRSMAFRLTFQHHDRTLRDDEVHELVGRIVGVLERDLNVRLRDG